jgi:UDP-N-acetyl-D-mannosaminuronic acid dehydrogenase
MNKINIIGLGYIGLPTALMFASHGMKVVGTDYNKKLVETLKAGELTFEEDGLEELFNNAMQNGIEFTTEYISTDMYIVAVPTPYIKQNKRIDPKYVVEAVKSIMEVCPKGATVVIESTISPGTIERYINPIIQNKGFTINKDLYLVHAPERIIPGNMIFELTNNSRTIGAGDASIGEKVKQIYSTFCKSNIIVTDIKTAEMTKVVENTYRDINIAFANELAKICRSDNMDVYEIIRIANMHPRVNILQPGPGVGGHCISVDPWFLVGDYPDLTNLILTARKTNDEMPGFVISRLRSIMKEKGITDIGKVGLYGLTYKENVDDTRESPTLQMIEKLDDNLSFGIKVFDPLVKKSIAPNQYYNFEEFINDIEILVVMVSHSHILENIDKIKNKVILDTRNIIPIDNVYKL